MVAPVLECAHVGSWGLSVVAPELERGREWGRAGLCGGSKELEREREMLEEDAHSEFDDDDSDDERARRWGPSE